MSSDIVRGKGWFYVLEDQQKVQTTAEVEKPRIASKLRFELSLAIVDMVQGWAAIEHLTHGDVCEPWTERSYELVFDSVREAECAAKRFCQTLMPCEYRSKLNSHIIRSATLYRLHDDGRVPEKVWEWDKAAKHFTPSRSHITLPRRVSLPPGYDQIQA